MATNLNIVDLVHYGSKPHSGNKHHTDIVKEVCHVEDGQEEEPEVKHKVEFFIDQVHHDDTLDRMILNISKATNLK